MKSSLVPLVLMFALMGLPAQAAADAYPRQTGVDAIHYTFSLRLEDSSDRIEGKAVVELDFAGAGVEEVALDLASASGDRGMTVSAVSLGGAPLRFEHRDDRLRIHLPTRSKAGERQSLTVGYSGIPRSGLRIGPNRHGERTFFSDNWPDKARQWLPMIDHPYDKATSEFLVTAPARYQVVSNGLLQEEVDLGDGLRRTHWKQGKPIASWLNALGVAQFASRHAGTIRGLPLQTWVFHQDRDLGIGTLEAPARRAVELFSDLIGPYPYEKIGGVQAAGMEGGMELASAVFYGEKAIDGKPADGLVAHELAHQWFGDAVTERDWDDVWLSEGFATYFAALYSETYSGRDAFRNSMRRSGQFVTQLSASNPGFVIVPGKPAEGRRGVPHPLIYQKGAWVLHMLRGLVGDQAFRRGIQLYYRRYRDGNVSTDDFRRVMEEASARELSWFFEQWLHRPGLPEVRGNWRYDPKGRSVIVELEQTRPGLPYRLPLDVVMAGAGGSQGSKRVRVELISPRQAFPFASEKEPGSVTIDPDSWVLMKLDFARKSE